MTRITKWLLFGVMCSLLPILIQIIQLLTRGQEIELIKILGHGQLFLISTAIAATGIGELVSEKPKGDIGKIISGFSSIVMILVSSIWFADVASASIAGETIDTEAIKNGSLWVFLVAVITTLFCFKQTEE